MNHPHSPDDLPFFKEWLERSRGEGRSTERAKALMQQLGIDPAYLPPMICVVGSKGKGTATAAATVALASQGLRVGSITSPALRNNRERIRLDGCAIDPERYHHYSGVLETALSVIGIRHQGYLSPVGAFLCIGLRYFLDQQVDVLVVEEGMGGKSDEISLLRPQVLAVTPVFLEHGEVFGNSVTEVAKELLGAICNQTRAIVTLEEQPPEARQVINDVSTQEGITLVTVPADFVEPDSMSGVKGLSRRNALLGVFSAECLLGRDIQGPAIDQALSRLWLPGRLSVHTGMAPNQRWVVDAAINKKGVEAALAWCRAEVGEPDVILLSVPLNKDRVGALEALESLLVVELAGSTHMEFARDSTGARLHSLDEFLEGVQGLGQIVLALGTITFIADVLEVLDVETSNWQRTN